MLKYLYSAVTFAEFPDEISLTVSVTNCPGRCVGCHSPELRRDIGTELTEENIDELFRAHPNVSCFGLLGGDSDHNDIKRIASYIRSKYCVKIGFYSGRDEINGDLTPYLDYYKIGRYIPSLGGLKESGTNQDIFEIKNSELKSIKYNLTYNDVG